MSDTHTHTHALLLPETVKMAKNEIHLQEKYTECSHLLYVYISGNTEGKFCHYTTNY